MAEDEIRLARCWEGCAKRAGAGAGFLDKAAESWRAAAKYYETASKGEVNVALSKRYLKKSQGAASKATALNTRVTAKALESSEQPQVFRF